MPSYLSNRQFYVFYNGHISKLNTALPGVPQGSNLGSLLFILFVKDLSLSMGLKSLMCADDVKLFRCVNSVDDCDRLQRHVCSLVLWCDRNNA